MSLSNAYVVYFNVRIQVYYCHIINHKLKNSKETVENIKNTN